MVVGWSYGGFSGGGGGTGEITTPVNNGVLVSDGTTTGIAATEILKVTPEGVVQFNTVSPTGLTGNTIIVSFDKTIGSAYYFDYHVTEQGTSASRSCTVIVVWKVTTV